MRAPVGSLLLLLASCEATVDVCHSCLKGDPAKPVAAAEVAKIGLVYSGKRLPKSATNVYYHEVCGIDCQQWVRFDAPIADARDFAQPLLVRPLSKSTATDQMAAQPALPGAELAKMPWWPKSFYGDTERGENTINDAGGANGKGQPLLIILQPRGENATVWLAAYST